VSSIVAGEYAENEIRKDFTLSERDAIRRAIEAAIPERRGRQNPDNCPELKGEDTREMSSRKAGFSSYKSAERVAEVVDHATPEVVRAMDSGELSIHAASKVAQQPPPEQKRIVTMPKPERRKAIKSLAPSPKKAREIAIQTGKSVVASNNKVMTPRTEEASKVRSDEQFAVRSFYDAVTLIATTKFSPAQMVKLGKEYSCRRLAEHAETAAIWLHQFVGVAHGKTA